MRRIRAKEEYEISQKTGEERVVRDRPNPLEDQRELRKKEKEKQKRNKFTPNYLEKNLSTVKLYERVSEKKQELKLLARGSSK